jgi:predicted secreted acid phosphatase
VRERGGVVAFVSNRNAEECPATEENLRAAGIQPDVVLCRTDMTDPGKQKELRFGQVTSGTARAGVPAIEPLLFTGDNIEDFPDLDQESVAAHPEHLDDFGSRYFMLPNPMYGSFEKNTPN